jgi:tight adherence protein B
VITVRVWLVAAVLVAVVPAGAVLAVEDVPAADDDAETALRIEAVDLRDHPQVRITASVSGHQGTALPGDAFAVSEDGAERPVQVRSVESSDLQVALLIDTTGSMGGPPLAEAKDAAARFIEGLPEDAAVAVLGYAEEVTLLTPLDADRAAHRTAIESLEAEGRTATYDAVAQTVTVFPAATSTTARSIVLLTDGEDNESSRSLDEVGDVLLEEGVTLHAIAYRTAFSDDEALRSLALPTGGTVKQADDSATLETVYAEIATDLTSRYVIEYAALGEGPTELVLTVDRGDRVLRTVHVVDLPQPPVVDPSPVPVAPDLEAAAPVPLDAGPGRLALTLGASAWFLALAVLGGALLAPRQRRAQSLAGPPAAGRPAHRHEGGVSELAARASSVAERGLARRGDAARLNGALEKAGIDLRPGEFLVLVLSIVTASWAFGSLLLGPLAGPLLALVVGIGARAVVAVRTSRRQARFADQLSDTLQLLAGSLRAGYSLMQAIDAVAREADAPTAEEFNRLVVETRLGRDTATALHAVADRVESEDFTWVMQAIEIHREVGGDLALVLDTVANTIRERNQIRRQVKALSAEGRMSAYVLLALPFGIGFMIYLTNRPYLAELTQGGLLGWGLIGLGLVLMTIGTVWLRSIVRFRF